MSQDAAVDTTTLALTGATAIKSRQRVQALWSGYGQILRYELQGAKWPSVIVKHVRWPSELGHPRSWNSDLSHQRKVESYKVETNWYAQYAMRCGATCRVPLCLASESQGDETFLVLEDLNAAGFAQRASRASASQVDACLSWLAHFHATFMRSDCAGLWPTGTYWHLATRPDELAALADGPLKSAAPALDRMLAASPYQTLVHGDAKLANFCFSSDGRAVAAVDFQYIGGGCGMKDLAYFVSSCFDEKESEEREAELLDRYFALLRGALEESESLIEFADLERDWRALYPVAWTDFYRFLMGWSPGHWKIHGYSERLAREVLAQL